MKMKHINLFASIVALAGVAIAVIDWRIERRLEDMQKAIEGTRIIVYKDNNNDQMAVTVTLGELPDGLVNLGKLPEEDGAVTLEDLSRGGLAWHELPEGFSAWHELPKGIVTWGDRP